VDPQRQRPARIILCAVIVLLAGCAGGRGTPQGQGQVGLASYYADRFHGRTTASGETFDMHAMTAAHRTLEFGTRVRVTRLSTGKSVVVRINDRGPFVEGRIIDLSRAAAQKLDFLETGVVKVRVQVIGDSGGL